MSSQITLPNPPPGSAVSRENIKPCTGASFWSKRSVKIVFAVVGVIAIVAAVAACLLFIPGAPLAALGAVMIGAAASHLGLGAAITGAVLATTIAVSPSLLTVGITLPVCWRTRTRTIPGLENEPNSPVVCGPSLIRSVRNLFWSIIGAARSRWHRNDKPIFPAETFEEDDRLKLLNSRGMVNAGVVNFAGESAPDAIASVVAIELDGVPVVE